MRCLVLVACALLLPGLSGRADARVYMTQQQAIQTAFPAPQTTERRTLYLSEEQARRAEETGGVPIEARVVPYYVGTLDGVVTGYAYFDTHLVRTLSETILVRVSPAARIVAIDIVSFTEPEDYLPGDRWLEQFSGKALDDELSLRASIRTLAGATLSARAVTRAARRVLALHQLFVMPEEQRQADPAAAGDVGP
jgi:electron transport complex protein RnfG